MALYLQADYDAPLVYGFYLRSIGAGLGINQALRGLGGKNQDQPIQTRIKDFVDDPRGLPNPRFLDSWEVNPPETATKPPRWMIVAQALITFGKLPPDKPHTIAGGLLLALDQNIRLVAGLNLWLFTSPKETSQAEFLARPAARGAIEISPREGKVFGYFRTLPNPKLGKDAPELIAQVLSKVQTSLMFLADKNGFLNEVGWPWETRAELPLSSPFRGVVTAGFRFGIYRGVTCYGLNFGVDVGLDAQANIDFKTPLGSAGAKLVVHGTGFFRASFVGALDQAMKPYLLGDVRVAATVNVRAEAHAELSKKITRWLKIRLRIHFSSSFDLAITAAMSAALDQAELGSAAFDKVRLGFDGDAHVSVSVSGYRINGQIPFKYNVDTVASVRKRLKAILPPPIMGEPPGGEGHATKFAAMIASCARHALADDSTPVVWRFRSRRIGSKLLVLLLPEPGLDYPGVEGDIEVDDPQPPHDPRFKLILTDKGAAQGVFLGFLGDRRDAPVPAPNAGDQSLQWSEDFTFPIVSAAQIMADSEVDKDDSGTLGEAPKDLTVLRLLIGLYQAQKHSSVKSSGFAEGTEEYVDPRTRRPSAEDADDGSSARAVRAGNSPYIKRDQEYDRLVTASCRSVEEKRAASDSSTPDNGEVLGLSTGMIAAELIALFRDDKAVETGSPGSALIAPRLRTILVFDLDKVPSAQGVADLIDVKTEHRLAGKERVTLKAVDEAALDEANLPRGYEVIPGAVFQSDGEVALAWDFRFKKPLASGLTESFLAPYSAGFESFRVTRTNLSSPRSIPKDRVVTPYWINPGDGKPLVRPQFQFVDSGLDSAGEVREGDLLEYRVEAVGQEGPAAPLASALFEVVRRTVKPLHPPDLASVLHRPKPVESTTEPGVFHDSGLFEFAVANRFADEKEKLVDRLTSAELRVRFRLVPARPVGAYGFESQPAGGAVISRNGLPAAVYVPGSHEIPEVWFGESERARPLPWEETLPIDNMEFDWKPLPDTTSITMMAGFRAEVKVDALRAALETALKRPLRPGTAVELWVGRDRAVDNAGGQTSRESSILRAFRHSVIVPAGPGEKPLPASVQAGDDFTLGNAVPAFEFLPEQGQAHGALGFLDPSMVVAAIRYGTVPTADAQTVDDVAIDLTWRMPPDDAKVFNPVVGFRLHRVDRFNPIAYRPGPGGVATCRPDQDVVTARPEREVRVVPAAIYEATPSTIELRSITLTDPQTKATRVVGDWSPTLRADRPWKPRPLPIIAGRFPYRDDPDRPGNTKIHSHLLNLLDEVCKLASKLVSEPHRTEVEVKYHCTVIDPLEDRADLLAQTDRAPGQAAARLQRLAAAFALFQTEHAPGSDPYGWGVADALGLGIEAALFDPKTGEPISINSLVAKGLLDRLHELADAGGFGVQVNLALFLAEDGATYLNLLRLVYAPPWPVWDKLLDLDIGAALILKLIGRDPDRNWPYSNAFFDGLLPDDPGLPRFKADVDDWLVKDVGPRLARGFGLEQIDDASAGRVVVFHRDLTALVGSPAPASAPASARTLPVDDDGLVRLKVAVPDRIAHLYDLALEIERRYDTLWSLLAPASTPRPAEIPYAKVLPVAVDRTRPLVPHNVLATPLPGSIQAYVFAHPAEFAANASAINAATIQYSGSTVSLERRIPQASRVSEIIGDRKEYPVNWAGYLTWLERNGFEPAPPEALSPPNSDGMGFMVRNGFEPATPAAGPALDPQPETDKTSLAMQTIDGTQGGLYGVDRYVFPDLPAYYEFRVVAFSTAGRAQSPLTLTPFVTPLHDQPRIVTTDESPGGAKATTVLPARQRPRTQGVGAASYDPAGKLLTLEIRLIHSRLHLRDEMAGLWIGSDDKWSPTGTGTEATEIHFGSLPDLRLDYQVYVHVNFDAPNQMPVLIPLLTIAPPLASDRPATTRAFLGRSQDKDVFILDRDETADGGVIKRAIQNDLKVIQRVSGTTPDPVHDGELCFLVKLDIAAAANLADLIRRAAASKPHLASIFEVSVSCGGVYSAIVPMSLTPAAS